MFQDNTALTWMLVILNVIFFMSAFAGLLFATIAADDMAKAKAAKKDAEKLFAEANARQVRSIRELNLKKPHNRSDRPIRTARETFKDPFNQSDLSDRTFLR